MMELARPMLGGFLAVVLATTIASAQCTAPAGWFPHGKTPRPLEADPGDKPCEFHRWSWQMFLWLTQNVDGDLRLVTQMHSGDDLFSLEHGDLLPAWATLKKGMLRLRPRDTKPMKVRGPRKINQAGDNGILVDQQGHAVYYAIHVNEIYYNFVRGRRYNDPQTLASAPADERFPVGTLEMKSSWRVVNEGDDTSTFYTTTAEIAALEARGDHTVVVASGQSRMKVKVALLGLHVAGVVKGHPEFIWATFEHRGNAPLLPAGMTMTSPNPVASTGTTLYAANTPAKDCNRTNDGHVTIVDPTTPQTLEPITHVVRQFASGSATGDPVVESLNKSVHGQLRSDIAANYDLIGSLWVDMGDLQPNMIPGAPDSQRGSIRLANTTMETFRQSAGNCFSCHDTRRYEDEGLAFPPKNLNVSHVLRRSYIHNAKLQASRASVKSPIAPRK